ncbi:MAG: tetratricopeptide repeat protein [Saprospiraceae bacterium]|nr:tetratricopeptide repeat protein [Lewinella sp.]
MKYPFVLLLISFAFSLTGQTTLEELVEEGIAHHDAGNYDQAIASYQKALALDENSALANYEIAMTYMYAKQYQNALKHADKVIKQGDQYAVQAYVTKGNCLDAIGESKKAVKTYNKAINKYGGNYMLYYNLGLTQYNAGDLDKAEQALIQAINDNPGHATSHFVLGHLMHDRRDKVRSLLALHYFLLLEPGTGRSPGAYELLLKQFGGNVKQTGENEQTIFLDMATLGGNSEFSSAELMLSMLAASNTLEENKDKTAEELFIKNTEGRLK